MRTGARGERFDLRVRGAGLRIWRGAESLRAQGD